MTNETDKKQTSKKQQFSLKDSLLALGRKFDSKVTQVKQKVTKKVQEEVQQFNDMGGLSHVGEYVAQNFNSVLAKGASTLARDDVAQKIKEDREEMLSLGRKFDKKVQEEVQQFNEMGGLSHAGEYVAQNFNSVLAKGASALGQEDISAQILADREKMAAMGRKFDKKIAEEVEQFQDMGGVAHTGEYLAQNFNSALAKGASMLARDDVAQKIKEDREEMLSLGRKFDKKVQEEVQQFNEMGGIGEYVAQNAVTIAAEFEYIGGGDEAKNKVEEKREKVMALGRKFDKKVAEEVEQFKQSESVSEYVAQNMADWDASIKKATINIQLPRMGSIEIKPFGSSVSVAADNKKNTSEITLAQGCPIKSDELIFGEKPQIGNFSSVTTYKKAELCMQSIAGGSTIENSVLDGKKHGMEIIRDKQNQVLAVKLYNHGQPIDIQSNKVDVRQEVGTNGVVHNYCLLNNHMFGTETFVHPDGRTVACFYEESGRIMNRDAHSQISYNVVEVSQNDDRLLANLAVQKKSGR